MSDKGKTRKEQNGMEQNGGVLLILFNALSLYIKPNLCIMRAIHPQYIIDNTGEKISVVLPIEEYQIILNELEELEDIRLYDEAKATGEPSIPIDKAFKMIEAERKKKK